MKSLINSKAQDSININDRGLLYGDGLFETMAVHCGVIPLWEDHWLRLVLGCEKLSINIPNKEAIEKNIVELCKSNSDSNFVIKLIVTRGEGARGYRFNDIQNITCLLNSHAWPDYPRKYKDEGVSVCYCETTLSENKKLAGIKHLNRLEQVLARNEWEDEYQEGLMLTINGHVVDGTMSNVFAVSDNKIFTPTLSLCGVAGVMRKTIIKIAKDNGFEVYEKDFSKSELGMADELFLTNSLFGIWPIKEIGKTRFTKVGGVTKLLQEKLNNLGL